MAPHERQQKCVRFCVCVRVTVSIYCLCVFQCFCEDVHICVCVCVFFYAFVCFNRFLCLSGVCLSASVCLLCILLCVFLRVFSVLFCCCRRKRLPTPTAVLVGTLGATWTRTHTFKKQQTTKTNKPPYMPIKKTQGQRERVGEREACLRQKTELFLRVCERLKKNDSHQAEIHQLWKFTWKWPTNKPWDLWILAWEWSPNSTQVVQLGFWVLGVLWLCFFFLIQQNTRW